MARGRGGRGGRRGGRRGGQGNRGRSSGRSGAGRGGSKGKGKGKGKSSSSRGRRGGQGNRGRTSTSRNAASNKGKRGGYGKGGASTGRRGGQGNRNRAPGRAKGYSVKSVKNAVSKGLSKVGNITRQLRQPVTGLSRLAIGSVLNNPAVARSIAQYGANTFGKQNQRTRDMSKLTPQQQRKFERLSEKTGRDYSIRNPTFRLNMNMRDIARFAGLDKSRIYNSLPKSIRNAQINKQFYGNPMKKGWHSSQRTGRGQGVKELGRMRDMMMRPEDWERQKQNEAAERQYEYDKKQYEMSKSRMGPQQDWLSSLYTSHNINRGKLDQAARDYWSNEAKTKGRDAVMKSIIGTSKVQGTYGGRKKPRSLKVRGRK